MRAKLADMKLVNGKVNGRELISYMQRKEIEDPSIDAYLELFDADENGMIDMNTVYKKINKDSQFYNVIHAWARNQERQEKIIVEVENSKVDHHNKHNRIMLATIFTLNSLVKNHYEENGEDSYHQFMEDYIGIFSNEISMLERIYLKDKQVMFVEGEKDDVARTFGPMVMEQTYGITDPDNAMLLGMDLKKTTQNKLREAYEIARIKDTRLRDLRFAEFNKLFGHETCMFYYSLESLMSYIDKHVTNQKCGHAVDQMYIVLDLYKPIRDMFLNTIFID